ncbi:sulfatase-like hydrolase/transferase [Flavitalea sp. BT771]|uniref:LTA synthase family protein n=1 Tax=Flavitalea sp. BT771 TaxID=3063329 RepID=UPI0026E1D114|nr:alkaline phosphatase family protein [Flavitalea sp. BT771]MDO6432455.1 sulfatase-like hydrolase/transferase [Flavitalea sp. BT771]MDV6221364.1 sulfatase-like hydrolase/transferase [Flavitalea sp. BT771]
MSLLRLFLFISFNKQGHSFSDLLPAFGLGVRFDLRYVGILCVLLLITGSFPFLQPFRRPAGRKWAIFLMGLAGFLVIFFYSVDFAHYSYLSQRLNASVLNYLADTRISAGMIWQTYPVIRILLLLLAGTWLVVKGAKYVYNRIRRQEDPVLKTSVRVTWFIIIFLLLGLAIFGRIGQFPLRWSDAFSLGNDYKANISLNPFQSFFSGLKFRHASFDEAKVKKALPQLAPFFGFNDFTAAPAGTDPLAFAVRRVMPARPGGPATPPNVVVVICESFSGYKSSMWGNPLNTTPFFNSMCQRGIFFDHCFTPSYGTARGVWATITGIPDVAISTSTSSRNPSAVDQHTIINDFSGYDKMYFLGGSTSWANIQGMLTNNIKGLKIYEQENFKAPKVDVWGISDKNLFLEANNVLKQREKPFFAVIQTADNHRPYTIPAEDRAAFHSITVSQDSLQKCGFATNDEMNAFRYTDFSFRTFIEAAAKEKYFDNTIFLFVGDHGIPGDAGTMFPRAWTDLWLTAEHVPLLVYSPKLLAPRRITKDCSQLDVLPTLAGLCHISYLNTTLGRDLLDSARYEGKALSFIFNPDQESIGVVHNGYFYRLQLKTGKEEMVSTVNNDPVPDSVLNGPRKKELRQLTEGIYQTAKYMILRNKK